MKDLAEKLATAKAEFEVARNALEKSRLAYESGAGEKYAEIKQNIAKLKAQIAEHQRAHQAAKEALSQAVNDSNGAMTAKTKDALAARRNAEDMIEECQGLLRQVEETAAAIRIEASGAARSYRADYQAASKRWAYMNTLAVLAECGERLCAAVSVIPDMGSPSDYDAHSILAEKGNMPYQVFLSELHKMVINHDGDTKPYVKEVGVCNLGSMSASEILSPSEIHIEKAKLAAAA